MDSFGQCCNEVDLYITKACPCNKYFFFSALKIETFIGIFFVFFFFFIFAQNIDCGNFLSTHRGSSNMYPQSMFWNKYMNNKPHLIYIKKNHEGHEGVYITRTCYSDGSFKTMPQPLTSDQT